MVRHRAIALFIALASGLALGAAFATEWWLHRPPCALCLWERWPYRVGIGLGVIALLLPPRLGKMLCWLALPVFLTAAGLAFVHAGVEWHFWPSPLPECAAPVFGGGSIADMLARMPARPDKPCDEPTYLIPGLPISIALANCLYALLLTVITSRLLVSAKPHRP